MDELDLAAAVDLGQQGPPQVTTQVITAPLHTEAVPLEGGILELNFLVMEAGEPIARTYRLGEAGRERLRSALAKLDGVGDG